MEFFFELGIIVYDGLILILEIVFNLVALVAHLSSVTEISVF